ncbi:MAG: ElyC/SanA/YdcF family protein [Pseudomonadota bacterium]|nr:ElyC/SanA/YdcF family protein [Pseudomonadota bacterium]
MEIGFLLKKIIGALMMPWSAFLCVLLLSLAIPGLRKRIGTIAIIGIIFLSVLMTAPVGYALFGGYERQYATPDLTRAENQTRWIVVLGGGVYDDEPGRSALSRLKPATLARLSEGLRLARELPEAKLVFTGSGVYVKDSNAELYARAAQELGFNAERMLKLGDPKDTPAEARAVKTLVGSEAFLLVTSASHLPRAMRLMEQKQLIAFAAPAHYEFSPGPYHWGAYLPSESRLNAVRRLWHEQVGQRWLDVQEWLNSDG